MKKAIMGALFAGFLLFPVVASASSLTQIQVNALIVLLQAFGVSPQIIAAVEADLVIAGSPAPIPQSSTPIQNGNMPAVTDCVPNPKLDVQLATSSIFVVNPGNMTSHFVIRAQYSTGCTIPEGTPWKWTAKVLGNAGPGLGIVQVQDKGITTDPDTFSYSSNQATFDVAPTPFDWNATPLPVEVVFTIGDTSATLQVPSN